MIDEASVNHGEVHFWTVSRVLKRARESLGLSLADVAGVLRIRLVQLQAIEDGRFDELPGTVYALGFVRSYADFLGLDSDRVVAMFRDEIAEQKDPPELVFPSPLPDSGVPGGALLMVAIVLAVVAYAGWYYVASPNRDLADLVPALPDRFVAMIDGDSGRGEASQPGEPSGREDFSRRPNRELGDLAGSDLAGTVETEAERTSLRTSGDLAALPGDPRDRTFPDPGPRDPAIESRHPDAVPLGRGPTERPPEPGAAGGRSGTEPGPTRPDRLDAARFDEPRRSHDATTAEAATPSEPPPGSAFGSRERVSRRTEDEPLRATVASFSAFEDLPLPPPTVGSDPAAGSAAAADRRHEPRIVIRAVADSWVQVNDSDGSLVMTRTLRPGERYEVPESEGLRLVTGNAGGLEILVDGRQVPALGASGAVLRNVPLDAQRLQDGTAVPN